MKIHETSDSPTLGSLAVEDFHPYPVLRFTCFKARHISLNTKDSVNLSILAI